MLEADEDTYYRGTRVVRSPPGEPDSQQVAGPTPGGEPRATANDSEKPSGGNVALQDAPPPHTPHSVLTEGSWKYLGGIPDWHYWNSFEKESEYVLSPNALRLTRSGSGVSILLEAIEGVAVDFRWSRPRFLMMFATSDGASYIATFEFRKRFRARKAAERFFLKLLELGMRPDESLADAATNRQGQDSHEAASPSGQAQGSMIQQQSKMNLYNLMALVLIGGGAVMGFIYLDGPEAVQEYLDGETNSSQPTQQVRNAYPPSVVQNFTDACMFTGGGQAYCSCALEEIQGRYSLEEYTTLEIRMLNTGQFPEELSGVMAKCIQ